MTGAYYKVYRLGKLVDVELEYLTDDERANLINERDKEYAVFIINLACRKLRLADQILTQKDDYD